MIEVLPTRKELFKKYLPKNGVGAELGVYRGENSIDLLEITKSKKIYLCDPLLDPDDTYEVACKNLSKYPQLELVRELDQDWLATVPDGSLDWAYVDTLHTYEQTITELHLLRSKVTQVIAGHDLCCSGLHGSFADYWSAGVLRALMEVLSEGWLEVVAITEASSTATEVDKYPSWACKVR